MKFYLKFNSLYARNYIWEFRQQNGGHVTLVLICNITSTTGMMCIFHKRIDFNLPMKGSTSLVAKPRQI